MKIITALGNEIINIKLREKNEHEIIWKDIQYQEALIEILEKNKDIELLILSSILPGELNIKELINIIKYKNPKIEIIIILEKEDEKIIEFIISKGINNIYYNNKISFEEIIKKIKEIENKNIINNKINKLEEIILEKNKKNYLKILINKFNYLKNKLKIKLIKINNKKNNKIISIIGDKKSGKTIFSLLFSLNIKNKKILIIDVNYKENNMKTILGKKSKSNFIKWKKNIDIIFIDNKEDDANNQKGKELTKDLVEKISCKYDYVVIDVDSVEKRKDLIKKSNKIICIVEANLLGIKETKRILEEVVNKQKNQKNKVKIVFNKHENTAIKNSILSKMFSDFKIYGTLHYDKFYNVFINSNGKIVSSKIKKEYKKIALKANERNYKVKK